MTNPIADNLLDQAREHLAKSDFANAAKSARAVLALDSENSDASDILKASEAAIGTDSANDESVSKNNLKLVAAKVQAAINVKNLDQAERLIQEYLTEYPDVPDAIQIQGDVLAAKQQKAANDRKRYQTQLNDEQLRRQYRNSSSRDSSKSTWGWVGLVSGVIGLFFFPVIFGPIGIILGAIAATDEDSRTLGMIVVITSSILMIFGIFWGMAVWEETFSY